MIELRNSAAQVIQPGAAVALDTIIKHTGCGECYRKGSNFVRLRPGSVYKVEFSGNVSSDTAGTPVQLAIAIGGSALPETVMESTPSAANAFNSVSTGTFIGNCCCGFDQITVVNSGTNPVILSANFNLRIARIG